MGEVKDGFRIKIQLSNGVVNEIFFIDWSLPFLPRRGDYFDVYNIIGEEKLNSIIPPLHIHEVIYSWTVMHFRWDRDKDGVFATMLLDNNDY